jgi:hypothetical protein
VITEIMQVISRVGLGFICDKARFYTCKGLFSKSTFSKHFYSNRILCGVDPARRIQVLVSSDPASAVAYCATAEYFQNNLCHKTNHPETSIEVTMP